MGTPCELRDRTACQSASSGNLCEWHEGACRFKCSPRTCLLGCNTEETCEGAAAGGTNGDSCEWRSEDHRCHQVSHKEKADEKARENKIKEDAEKEAHRKKIKEDKENAEKEAKRKADEKAEEDKIKEDAEKEAHRKKIKEDKENAEKEAKRKA